MKLTTAYSQAVQKLFPEFLLAFEDSMRRRFNVMMPCRVVAYDRKNHGIRVQPLIRFLDPGDKNGRDRPEIVCTALRCSSGNFVIDMPIKVGDTGWVIAADVDTSTAKNRCLPTGGTGEGKLPGSQNPVTGLTHSFKSGIYIPDRWKDLDLYQERTDPSLTYNPDPDRLTIQSLDGKQRISIGTQGGNLTINVNAADAVNVITTNPSSSVNVTTKKLNVVAENLVSEETEVKNIVASRSITESTVAKTITANVTINGNLTVNGNISTPSNYDIIAGTVSQRSHIHSGVTPGQGTSGIPVQ